MHGYKSSTNIAIKGTFMKKSKAKVTFFKNMNDLA